MALAETPSLNQRYMTSCLMFIEVNSHQLDIGAADVSAMAILREPELGVLACGRMMLDCGT